MLFYPFNTPLDSKAIRWRVEANHTGQSLSSMDANLTELLQPSPICSVRDKNRVNML